MSKLPWTFWAGILVLALVAAAIAAALGLNPYVAASITVVVRVLHEVWLLKRAGV